MDSTLRSLGLGKAPKAKTGKLGIRVVCISDTHDRHHQLVIPDGDVLIHAGDFSFFGRDNLDDLNAWFGTLTHQHKILVNGNHDCHAPWSAAARSRLSNVAFLLQEELVLPLPLPVIADTADGDSEGAAVGNVAPPQDDQTIKIFGTQFTWPTRSSNPLLEQIPQDTDIIVTHGPPYGLLD
jgi:predicted phosphohydrolase